MPNSRALMLLWGGFIGLAAFVVGRTTAPSGVSAAASDQRAVAQDTARQIAAAVNKELEGSMKERFPAMMKEGIVSYLQTNSPRAVWNSMESMMQTLRSQLALYKVQHGDRFPTFSEMREWLALLEKTDAQGRVDPRGEFGPYLMQPPSNPFTGLGTIVAVGQATKEAGWTYDERTGELRAVITHTELAREGTVPEHFHEQFEFAPEN